MTIRRWWLGGVVPMLVALGLGLVCALWIPPHSAAGAVTPADATQTGPSTPWVAPEVLRDLATSREQPLHIIALLATNDITPLSTLANDPDSDRLAARTRFVHAQQQAFAEALAPLHEMLTGAAERGSLLDRDELWLIHGIALTARPDLVRQLMMSPAIAEIHLDHYRAYVVEPEGPDGDGEVDGNRAADSGEATPSAVTQIILPWGIERIQAPQVWANLGITGTGAVVAVVDTGVEWMHPDLIAAYRGTLGKGLYDHSASWYDAVNEGAYPYDDYGHGTHVAGTAVGAATGVAPGARWIGVKVLNNEGYGYDSWILGGLQWLLAPGGDPSLAPDVVNASWGNTNGYLTGFLPTIEALEAAGIFPVFAAGNSGPTVGSVSSPASNLGVFAVGASDPDDEVAPFSGRGPSPFGEVKPVVVGPGVGILSTIPGGIYGEKNGTSMATPHVTGLGALMRAVSPTVSVQTMAALITGTAHPLTATVPNNDSGWGRIDAYAALIALTQPSTLRGMVRSTSGGGIAGATITLQAAAPGAVGPVLETQTDASGGYFLALSPGQYSMSVAAFGYTGESIPRVIVLPDTETTQDITLMQLPTGTLRGRLTTADSGDPVTSTVVVRALDTPVSARPDTDGTYTLILPAAAYTVQVRGLGYRVVTETVTVTAGQIVVLDFALTSAPDLLLVDEGAWTYSSQITYWRNALDELRYAYDEITVKVPGRDTPISTTLQAYDVVFWSSPNGAPGLVGAGQALADYLDSGGRLMVSGQDVGYFDGGGLGFWGYMEPYLYDRMGVEFANEEDTDLSVVGRGLFEGIALDLTGEGGADNQMMPDTVNVRDPLRASPVWHYADGGTAGVAADICVPHRSLFFGFGYEAIADVQQRTDVMQRSIDWLMTRPLTAGLTLAQATRPIQIGRPGESVTHVLKVRHIGSAGVTETVRIATHGNQWPTAVLPEQFELAPCATELVTVTVTIPGGIGVNETDLVTIATTSTMVTAPVTVSLTSKTPAPVLLVDDDRWYPVEDRYKEAFIAKGIPFDLWDTQSGQGGTTTTSPLTTTLAMYPVTVWFTGYDWYAPVTDVEIQRLMAYLDGGGRLLLSSQDFVYHHEGEPLTRRLGILAADWADTTTEAIGVSGHPAGGTWGPVSLDYPFPNWSHTVEPTFEARPVIRGQLGQPVGIAAGSMASGKARTLFYALPLEALPLDARTSALAHGIGWLSPLGGSDWTATPETVSPGDTVTLTLVLRNDARAPLATQISHHIPGDFAVNPGHMPPSMTYDGDTGTVSWMGVVTPDEDLMLTWQATWTGGMPVASRPTVTLAIPAWDLAMVREAHFYGDGADLTKSRWLMPGEMRVGTPVSLTFVMDNQGGVGADPGELSLWMMRGVGPITATLPLTHGVGLPVWSGTVSPQEQQLLTVPVRGGIWDTAVRLDALIDDGAGNRWERSLWVTFAPWRAYLPTIMRGR